ncbi:MAG TPA: response regulator transcription factor [Longimicrobiaceae bacterium]|jgi:two-component system response regulator NreC|nr:response regulator transcription factor [Longimicrobiaceae bacterium]
METIRVLLADDHPVLRAGLRALLGLESDMEVVGDVGTGEEALECVRALRPDVVVMDLAMPGVGGLEATRRIIALGQGTRVLVLTSHAEDEYLRPVLEAGGSGYVQKTRADEDLISAIRLVARDGVFLYPSAVKLVLKGYRTENLAGADGPLADLSEREREVLALTVEGFSASEIGRKLSVSPKTVETYRARFMEKLGLAHRSDLVRLALETGVLKAGC